jgi:hypothetical protein
MDAISEEVKDVIKQLLNNRIYIYPFLLYHTLRCRGFHFSLDFTQSVGILERVIGTSQGLYLNTGQHKHRINAHTHTKHPCPKSDSNPRSQRPRERRQFLP